ncbi:MAG: hypothetical protein AAFU71_15720 [Cyanobacteria bacterium J06632_22]
MGSLRLIHIKVVLGLIGLICLALGNLHSHAQSRAKWLQQTTGSYQSTIQHDNSQMAGTTTFQKRGNRIEGTYTINEPTGTVSGTLTNCRAVETLTVLCAWEDSYGTGSLKATFTNNFSGFEGDWWIAGAGDFLYPWDGSKTKD